MSTFNGVFVKDLAERAIKTFAQSVLATVGTGTVVTAVTDVDWADAAAIGVTATIISVLTSIVSAGVAHNGTASVVPEVVAAPGK